MHMIELRVDVPYLASMRVEKLSPWERLLLAE